MSVSIAIIGSDSFIGKNLVKAAVDNSCSPLMIPGADTWKLVKNPPEFLASCQAIVHLAAVTDTTCQDYEKIMEANFELPRALLVLATALKIRFVYASSAAVYGNSSSEMIEGQLECPPNLYGRSKLAFDSLVREHLSLMEGVVGLRFFNVYGPGEEHKGKMASMVYQAWRQLMETRKVKLFKFGEQSRDFVHVQNVCEVILHMAAGFRQQKGIFNVGTGASISFREMGHMLTSRLGGEIEYINMSEELKGHYQEHTQAGLEKLRNTQYTKKFLSLEEGLERSIPSWTDAWREEKTRMVSRDKQSVGAR